MSADLRLGKWQEVLRDVEMVDAVITDPPFSERTDGGYRSGSDPGGLTPRRQRSRARGMPRQRNEMPYAPIDAGYVAEFVAAWVPRVRHWFVIFGDHVSARWWTDAFDTAGLLTFAPVPWVKPDGCPRFMADGPANSCEWITVARHRRLPVVRESRPGFYCTPIARDGLITGGKPIDLMRAVVRDYTRPGDLIAEPHAGSGTTLIAAAIEGRRCVAAEMDPATHAVASRRIAAGFTPNMFAGVGT